ncbi:MAG: PEP-CTERM sorting domain-containing protein [Planctomycetota bacterium]
MSTSSVQLGPGGVVQIGDPDNARPGAGFLDPAATITGNTAFPFSSGGTVRFAHSDASYQFANRMNGPLEVVHGGSGKTVLTGSSGYTGKTSIVAGTLALSGSGSIASSGTIAVAAGAMLDVSLVSGTYRLAAGQVLEGAGTVAGDTVVAAGATVAPGTGASVGTLLFQDDLTLLGKLSISISGSNASLVDLSGGTFTLGNASVLAFTGDAPTAAAYVFASYDALAGTFASVEGGVPAGYHLVYNYLGGSQMALVAVPEPASLALVGMAGLSGLVWRTTRRTTRRSRRRAAGRRPSLPA